jgi:hypothetical protein
VSANDLCWALAAVARALRGAEPVVGNIAFDSCMKTPDHSMLDRALTLPIDVFLLMGRFPRRRVYAGGGSHAIEIERRHDEQDLQDGSGFCFGSVTVMLH